MWGVMGIGAEITTKQKFNNYALCFVICIAALHSKNKERNNYGNF